VHTAKGDLGEPMYPLVPGHELSGIVEKVGKNVTEFKIGDKIGVGCIVESCLKCNNCNIGREQLCDN